MYPKLMPGIIVIGAGASGFSSAIELADRGYIVTLIEQATLGSGSSGRNPGRMGHGFHYLHIETAIMYLRASIQIQRKYPNYLVGKELDFNHPLRHGRYFIIKDAENTPEKILVTYNLIKEEYIRLIAEDPKNEVFGDPEHFFRILNKSEYEGQVNSDIVEMGVETAEHLFNWSSFVKDINNIIRAHKNITLYENTEVVRIERGDLDQPRFTLFTKDKGSETTAVFHTDYLINSTWENIERLNYPLGIPLVPGARTNRLKALLIVKLPESLVQSNSMFFCMGPHCMFSNMGNGYGMLTFANITNMEASTGLNLSERAYRLLNNDLTDIEKDDISQRMLAGVAHYIPGMADATIVGLKFGIVQTAGTLSLDELKNPMSTIHKRDYDGIRVEQVGLTSSPCMKLFYFVRNGLTVADLVDEQVISTLFINECIRDIEEQVQKTHLNFNVDIKKTVLGHMERYFFLQGTKNNSISSVTTSTIQTMMKKYAVNSELKEKTATESNLPPQDSSISSNFLMQIISASPKKLITAILLAAGPTALLSYPFLPDLPDIPLLVSGGIASAVSISYFAGRFFTTISSTLKTAPDPIDEMEKGLFQPE